MDPSLITRNLYSLNKKSIFHLCHKNYFSRTELQRVRDLLFSRVMMLEMQKDSIISLEL